MANWADNTSQNLKKFTSSVEFMANSTSSSSMSLASSIKAMVLASPFVLIYMAKRSYFFINMAIIIKFPYTKFFLEFSMLISH